MGLQHLGLLLLLPALLSCSGGGTERAWSPADVAGSYSMTTSLECDGADIEVKVLSGSRVAVEGMATWCRSEEAALEGAINVGELNFEAELIGNRLEMVDSSHLAYSHNGEPHHVTIIFSDSGCSVTEENGGHGLNVSFQGTYRKE